MVVTMTEQIPDARRSTDAAMALAHAATATHAIAEVQAAEQALRDELERLYNSHDDDVARALKRYRESVREALERYNATRAVIRGENNDEDED